MEKKNKKKIIDSPLEFKVNKFLTLKLENGKTNIYVNGKIFNQCKFLLLDIPIDEVEEFIKIESIDEAEEKLNRSLEPIVGYRRNNDIIPRETEFWAHCSSLQVWYENDYNTRLLHRNLAFSLLAELTEVGDSTAKKVFNEEIVKRFLSGHFKVMEYLFELDYLGELNDEEYKFLLEQLEARGLNNYITYEGRIIDLYNPKYKSIIIDPISLKDIPSLANIQIDYILKVKNLEKFTDIETLDISGHKITEIKGLENFTNLKKLWLWDNQISEIKGLDNLENLEELRLAINNISEIKGLENLKNLKILWLKNNKITKIEGLDNLINLKVLWLDNNKIKEIEGLENLTNLKELWLKNNQITEIKGLDNLVNLEELILYKNPISEIKGLENLKNLKYFGIDKITEDFGTDGRKYVEYCLNQKK